MKFKFINTTLIIVISASLLFFTSCKKYEDGPLISFRSKAQRLNGLWRATKQVENGKEFLNNHTIKLDLLDDAKDPEGSFNTYTLYTSDGSNAIEKYYGVWELSDDKENITMYSHKVEYNYDQSWHTQNIHLTITLKILRLTNKELWLERNDPNYHQYIEYEKE